MEYELNSWQRLWLVTAVVYLLCIIATGFVIMPTRQDLGRDFVNRVIDEVHKYDPFAFVGEAPHQIYAAAEREGVSQWEKRTRTHFAKDSFAPGFDVVEQDYHQALSGLAGRQFRTVIMLALGWLVPMALLTLLNRTVRWIMQGSRRKKHLKPD